MQTSLFNYPLPERLIAQTPAARRDEARLLVVDRKTRTLAHRRFRDLTEYLRAGDCLFRNNAAVIPARLHAVRPSGGAVECLLLRPASGGAAQAGRTIPEGKFRKRSESAASSPDPHLPSPTTNSQLPSPASASASWWCLLRPGKKLPVGATFARPGFFSATVLEKTDDGLARVQFDLEDGDLLEIANRVGEMPLPPYIERNRAEAGPGETHSSLDRERYQTVYADRAQQVAAAAPTAGLHFTPELLATLATQGVATADLTLHVGLGTFRPIATEHVEDHAIHREIYEIGEATQRALAETKGRRVAVGTTAVRTIEDFLQKRAGGNERTAAGAGAKSASETEVTGGAKVAAAGGESAFGTTRSTFAEGPSGTTRGGTPASASGTTRSTVAEADIFIYPPRTFRGVDALITNFHQPRSTLLCLVSAFLTPGSTEGIAWLKEIYAEAVAREYRFFSYGDAMLIL